MLERFSPKYLPRPLLDPLGSLPFRIVRHVTLAEGQHPVGPLVRLEGHLHGPGAPAWARLRDHHWPHRSVAADHMALPGLPPKSVGCFIASPVAR